MTTRREKLEARLERRREWMASRQRKAEALRNATPEGLRHDWAFITQPGHIPERARMNARDERAYEHQKVAQHHGRMADGLEHQLERCIFSDDPDAVEALQARIAALEAEQTERRELGAAWRKAKRPSTTDREGWQRVVSIMGWTEDDPRLLKALRDCRSEEGFLNRGPVPGYMLSNLGANIRRLKQRVAQVQARQERTAKAEASGVCIEGGDYVAVTFPEKPERDILDALRGAGFRWSGGSWCGERAKLPASVLGMVQS